MHILVTGASGLIGSALVPYLQRCGHEVICLVRGKSGRNEPGWDPEGGQINLAPLEQIDAVIHLAGENISRTKWTARQKTRILNSRVKGTQLLAEALAKSQSRPKVLLSASAVGFYGDREDQVLDESSSAGWGFMSRVCQKWEEAAQKASKAGIRVATIRLGMVLSLKGGALKKMLLPFKLGLGGPIGLGEQYMSWIGIDDVLAAIQHLLDDESLSGPVNLTSPEPVTNDEFSATLARVLHRPTLGWMPAFLARRLYGEMADELLLADIRVQPQKLMESGYEFQSPDLEGALKHLFERQHGEQL